MIRIKLTENNNKIEQPEFIGATLLTIDQFYSIQNHIPKLNEAWWLKDTCIYKNDEPEEYEGGASAVDGFNFVVDGLWPDSEYLIRPVLIFNANSLSFSRGDKFYFDKYPFTVFEKGFALCDDAVSQSEFSDYYFTNEAPEVEDNPKAFNYENSVAKESVDSWFNSAKQKNTDFFTKENIDLMLQNDNPELRAQLLQINHDLGFDNRADRMQKEIDDLFGDL